MLHFFFTGKNNNKKNNKKRLQKTVSFANLVVTHIMSRYENVAEYDDLDDEHQDSQYSLDLQITWTGKPSKKTIGLLQTILDLPLKNQPLADNNQCPTKHYYSRYYLS